MARIIALIVAAGRGTRLGCDSPKQYLPLGNQAILRHSLGRFCANPQITNVACVIHPDDRELYNQAAENLPLLPPIMGGETRQESVRLGLKALETYAPDQVLIHDAARPFTNRDMVDRIILALDHAPAAIPIVNLVDTLKQLGDKGEIIHTLDRNQLGRAQTPQGFHFKDILSAHHHAKGQRLTDDSAVAELAGLKIISVKGDEANLKITTAKDLDYARQQLEQKYAIRVGSGFDVHRLETGYPLWLGGINIPHSHGLKGHSDADVALHALTDAVLGSFAAGDIGVHFPPSNPHWKGASSDQFLCYAVNLLNAIGGKLNHLDLTIICESPKITPYRQTMVRHIAAIAGLSLSQVSVKATTTEGMGFTGRKEAIAAQAPATAELPLLL